MYKIRDWEKYYETSETRKWKTLKWLPLPVKLDGRNYRRMMKLKRKKGAAVYGCWCSLLAVATKGVPRGSFQDSTGNAFTLDDMELMTEMPQSLIRETLSIVSKPPYLWVESVGAEESPASTEECSVRIEQNRIEQNGTANAEEPPPHFTCKFFSVTEAEHERYTTAYLFSDIDRAYEKMVAWLYANPKKSHKKDWPRFVNNWLKSDDDDAEMEAKNRKAKDRGTVREERKFNDAPCIVCGQPIGLDTCVVVMKADKNEHGYPIQIDMGVSHSTEDCYNKPPKFTKTGAAIDGGS